MVKKRRSKINHNDMSDKEIKEEYYLEIDNELKIKYKEYNGVDADDTRYMNFTEKQQIEKYARNLAFWILQEEEIDLDKDNGRQIAKHFFVSNCKIDALKKIKDKFNDVIQKKIFERVEKLSDKEYNQKINLTKIKMGKILNEARTLYSQVKNSSDEDNEILDPVQWVYNQTEMRESWEKYLNDISQIENGEFLNMQINNDLSKYMNYMCENFPMGFGDALLYKVKNNLFCDGAEIYLVLSEN